MEGLQRIGMPEETKGGEGPKIVRPTPLGRPTPQDPLD